MRVVVDDGRGLEGASDVGAEFLADIPDSREPHDDDHAQHGEAPGMAAQEVEGRKLQAHGDVPDGTAMLPRRASRPRARAMAHDAGMTVARHRWSILLLPLLLTACGGDGVGTPDAGPTARFDSPDAELRWQGVLACADCDGIDTRLRLQRGNGVVAQYELVEAFLDGEGAEYFREEGRWRRDGRVLRLQATSGGERWYAIDGAGNLEVVDRRGHAAGVGHTLAPAGPPGL